MNISGILSGAVLLIIGLLCLILGIFIFTEGGFIPLIIGIVFACAGAYMLLHSEKEDKIEPIRGSNKKK